MTRPILLVVLQIITLTGMAMAADRCPVHSSDTGSMAIETVTGTVQSAADGTGKVVNAAAHNAPDAPLAAIQATKDTANTALERADAAIKSFTGQE